MSKYTDEQKYIEDILLKQFGELRALLRGLFSGENPDNFFPIMASVGGAIRNCWKHKVTPRYSGPSQM